MKVPGWQGAIDGVRGVCRDNIGVPPYSRTQHIHDGNRTVTWCKNGVGVMHSERRTAGLRLYNSTKELLPRDGYCRLDLVLDEQLL